MCYIGGALMAHVSLRVTDEEKEIMDSYAKFHGMNLSDAIKTAFFQKLEDEYDLKAIAEFEKEKAEGKVEYYSFEEIEENICELESSFFK